VKDYKARLFERDGVALDFLGTIEPGPFGGILRLDIPQGRNAAFLGSRLTVTTVSNSESQTVDLKGSHCQERGPVAFGRKQCDFATRISDQQETRRNCPSGGDRRYSLRCRGIRFSLQSEAVACFLSV